MRLALTERGYPCNSQTAHFLDKLKRLCGYKVAEHAFPGGATAYVLLSAVCNNAPKEGWPDGLSAFVVDVRERLGLADKPDFKVNAATKFPFPVLFAFHWWEQQEFASMGQKRMMLSPIFKVQRTHIRLDATHLCLLMDYMTTGPEAVALLRSKTVSIPETPLMTKKDAKARFGDRADEEWRKTKDLRASRKLQETAFKTERANLRKLSSASTLTNTKPVNVEKAMHLELPLPNMTRPLTATDNAVWSAQRKELQLVRDAVNAQRNTIMDTQAYKDAFNEYEDYENKKNVGRRWRPGAESATYAMSLFRNFNDRNPKRGWKPSASIVTDSVSISITYERKEKVTVWSCAAEEALYKAAKAKKCKQANDAKELPPCDNYDPFETTCCGDALVLGLDPGRKTLATIVCIDYKGKKHTWSISRGTYHTASGILRQNALHAVRYSGIADCFASLTADGGALRASTSAEIVAYVAKYMTFEAEWWSDFALRRRESRSKFQRFVGKQKTLASFFGNVRKEADALKGPGQTRIEVAYGAAGRTMAPTGRGELAVGASGANWPRSGQVPTKGTFAFCARAFLGERPEDATSGNVVSFEDESNTSKKCWMTRGTLYEKVYKTYNADGKVSAPKGANDRYAVEFLHHTSARYAPFVPDADVAMEENKALQNKDKAKRRRGGGVGCDVPLAPITGDENEEKTKKIRHAVCRGLLFCPETSMYYDRDESSARGRVAAAGLRPARPLLA